MTASQSGAKKPRKGNIALFVPHNGCPHQCSFCNQRSITGVQKQPSVRDVHSAVETAQSAGGDYDREIAFFGGSFTAIERGYMISLLEAAYDHVKNGEVSGIRLSTRPDAIDRDVLDILKNYGVTSIELGAQSMCDDVLKANLRGHTASDVENASRLITEYGFSLGLQMMTGLYKSDNERDIYTAERFVSLAPDTVRIYPTITLDGTLLGELYKKGEYTPPKLCESVDLCASLLELFGRNNIEVIRLGLHYSDELIGGMLYNNYHPAFRELCENKLMLERFFTLCAERGITEGGYINVRVNPSCVSKFVGQKRANIRAINERGIFVKTKADSSVLPLDIELDVVSRCCRDDKVRK